MFQMPKGSMTNKFLRRGQSYKNILVCELFRTFSITSIVRMMSHLIFAWCLIYLSSIYLFIYFFKSPNLPTGDEVQRMNMGPQWEPRFLKIYNRGLYKLKHGYFRNCDWL